MIYCNGDSFTQGSELADHIFYKEIHPGYVLNKDRHNHIVVESYQKLYMDTIFRKIITNETKTAINDDARSRAWPAKLEKLLNIPVINAGMGGSSMDSIASRTMLDIINFQNKGQTVDLVVIQLTFMNRFDVSHEDKVFSVTPTHLEIYKNLPIILSLAKLRISCENEFTHYKNWLSNIANIINFCKANQLPLYFVQSLPYGIPTGQYEKLLDLEQYVNLNFDLSMHNICKGLSDDIPIKCPGGHFTEIVHDELAKAIAKKI